MAVWTLPDTMEVCVVMVEVMMGVAHVCVCINYVQLASTTRQVISSLSLVHFLLAIASGLLAPQSQQHSFPELATEPTRYISSTPKEQGTLMRHGRGLYSSFIILLPPIPTPFYQAPAGLCVVSSDINQMSVEARALIMPY